METISHLADTEKGSATTELRLKVGDHLGQRAREILRCGVRDHGDVMGLADAVANAYGHEDDLDDLLAETCSWWREISTSRRRNHLARWMGDARRWVARRPAVVPVGRVHTARQMIAAIAAETDGRDWGRTSAGRVLDAVLASAWARGRVRHLQVSTRDLAERAGVDHRTVQRCLPLLTAGGLLTVTAPTRHGHAVSITLATPRTQVAVDTDRSWAELGRIDWTADAHRWAGWGTTGAVVEHALDVPISDRDLAARLGLSLRAVRRALRQLAEFGRAVETEAGWVPGTATLAEAARAMGPRVDGAGARQRRQHELARQGLRRLLAWRAEQSPPQPNARGGLILVLREAPSDEERRRWSRPSDADLPLAA